MTSLTAGDVTVEVRLTEEMRQDEISRLRKEISRVEAELNRAESKLSNEKFVERAPAEVVEGEREKRRANGEMLVSLRERLEEFG